MATSLEEKLVDIAREFEETKSRQLELYQRQLRRAREQLQERDTELADKIEELEYTKHNAEEAEASRAIEADNALMLTREVIALKFQLADAFEKLMEQVPPKAACSEAGSDEDVFPEPTMPHDAISTKSFCRLAASGDEDGMRAVLSPACSRQDVYQASIGAALVDSCSKRGSDIPRMLIEAGAALTSRGAAGRTALHAAAAAGDNEMVQILLQQEGVDKDAVDDSHRTALHLAARTKRVAVVQTLLQLGADAQIKSADGKTARDLAVDPLIGTGDVEELARVFDGPETRFWNHSARAVALHRGGELEDAFAQYGSAISLASELKYTLSADDRARLH